MEDYYSILEVSRTANINEIKNAFKKLSLKYHPDKQVTENDTEADCFIKIFQAWSVLSDPTSRQIYDRKLAETESFHCLPVDEELSLQHMTYDQNEGLYKKVCRCGGEYTVDEDDVISGEYSYVNCNSCSLCIRLILAATSTETLKNEETVT